MPTPKQDLKPVHEGSRFRVLKDDFNPASTATHNWGIYWSAEGTQNAAPFAYAGRHYHRIAYGFDLDKLAFYVDNLERTQQDELEAVKAGLKQHKEEFEHCMSALSKLEAASQRHAIQLNEHVAVQTHHEDEIASHKQHKEELQRHKSAFDLHAQILQQHVVEFKAHVSSQRGHKDELERYYRSAFDLHEQTVQQQTIEFEANIASQRADFMQTVAVWDVKSAEVSERLQASRDDVTARVRSLEEFVVNKVDIRTERMEVAIKAFGAKSPFLSAYGQTGAPASKDEFFVDMDRFILSFATGWGAGDQVAHEFCRELRRNCESGIAERPPGMTELQYVAARFWTTPLQLCNSRGEGKEPSAMLNQATRIFSKELMTTGGGLRVHRAINTMCNVGRQDGGKEPLGRRTYRGVGLPRSQLSFWKRLAAAKEEYRVPFALATSENPDVSTRFLHNIPSGAGLEPTRFMILFTAEDGASIRCVHVNYLEPVSSVRNEAEWLFSAFSTFTPLSVKEQAMPTVAAPHEIILRTSRDNLCHSEYLLLAEWH